MMKTMPQIRSTVAGVLCLLAGVLLSSCAHDPEGTTYDSVPVGYTSVVVGGITYWHYDDHYCRYWPGYGYVVVPPPYHRPPYDRPPVLRPPGERPGKPGERPGINPPKERPGKPGSTDPGRVRIQPIDRTLPSGGGFSRGGRGGGFSGGGMGGGRLGGRGR